MTIYLHLTLVESPTPCLSGYLYKVTNTMTQTPGHRHEDTITITRTPTSGHHHQDTITRTPTSGHHQHHQDTVTRTQGYRHSASWHMDVKYIRVRVRRSTDSPTGRVQVGVCWTTYECQCIEYT